jgi:hypothetical protein
MIRFLPAGVSVAEFGIECDSPHVDFAEAGRDRSSLGSAPGGKLARTSLSRSLICWRAK